MSPTKLELYVKRLIQRHARSTFRKKGPGRTAQLRGVLNMMTQKERKLAKSKGWDKCQLKTTADGSLVVSSR